VPGLAKVVYHNKLGTQGERIERVRAIAKVIGADSGATTSRTRRTSPRAWPRPTCSTDMVGEFPSCKGIMGGYYARHDGLGEDVAFAIEDHYRPALRRRRAAAQRRGVVVALADKLETLAACSPSASCPPATRTRSRCAATRWASCAC
jgi:glycyl-tRNA synthetase beta chain